MKKYIRLAMMMMAAESPQSAVVHAQPPTTASTQAVSFRSPTQIVQDLNLANKDVGAALADPQVFSDPRKRAAAAPAALAALRRLDLLFVEIVNAKPDSAAEFNTARTDALEYRAALDDADAAAKLLAMAADPDTAKALRGKLSQLKVQWLKAGPDEGAQTKVADAAEPLAKAHPESGALTVALVNWAQGTSQLGVADRLLAIAGGMSNRVTPLAASAKQQLDAKRKMLAMENKPFVLQGTTVDGKPFSTSAFKGKVVLIDFWATWCAPCKAQLPAVQAVYAKYHDQGLEVVGVSNDYSPDALTTFTKEHQMPWPQLYNADAGSNHEWNPTTLGYGIDGIPHMFLIDRDGTLLSADARSSFEKMVADLFH